MSHSDQTNTKRKVVGVSLTAEAIAELERLAEGCGMGVAKVASALLEELAPKIAAVRPRKGVAIELRKEKTAGDVALRAAS